MSLTAGTPAPAFSLKDQNGNTQALSDFKGKKVVLYFYPKDDTPGCTLQACNLRDNSTTLQDKGIVVLGASTDDEQSHDKFSNKFDLNFPLLADTEQTLVNDYDVWQEQNWGGKNFMGTSRVTYLINEEGLIDAVIDKVDTKNHTAQILETWEMQ